MKLSLVRHTQVDMPRGICYGHTDVGLADSFTEEVEVVKKRLKQPQYYHRVYSSPLQRCAQLADKLTHRYVTDERIKEFNFGDWECVEWNDIYATEGGKRWFDDYVNTVCPNGESFRMMLRRVGDFLISLPPDEEELLIITHAGIMRAFLILLKDYSVKEAFDTAIAYGDVITIGAAKGQFSPSHITSAVKRIV